MKYIRTAAVAAVLLTSAACGSRSHTAQPTMPAETPVSGRSQPGSEPLNGTWNYGDGITVSLSGFGRGKSSDIASPNNVPFISFSVSLSNRSGQSADLEWMTVNCTAGGQPAERVFDTGYDLSQGHLLPGRSYRIKAACAVPESVHSVQIEVSPDFSHESAVFTGTVA